MSVSRHVENPSQEMEPSRRKLLLESVLTAGAMIASQALTLLATLVVARAGGPSLFGQLSIWLAITTLLVDVANLGTVMHLTREMARGQLSPGAATGFALSRSAVLAIPVFMVASVCAILLGNWLYTTLAAGLILAQLTSLSSISLLRAAQRYGPAALCIILERIVLAVSIVLTAHHWDAISSYLLGMTAGTLTSLFLSATLLRAKPIFPPKPFRSIFDLYVQSRHFGISSIASDLSSLEAPIVIAISGSVAGGRFAAANRFSGPLGMPASAMSTALFPRLSNMSPRAAAAALFHARLLVAVLFIPLLLVVFFFGQTIVVESLGAAYGPETARVLQWIVVAVLLGSQNQLTAVYLQARGAVVRTSRIVLVSMLCGLVAVFAGALLAGALGASIGIVLKEVMASCLLLRESRHIQALSMIEELA